MFFYVKDLFINVLKATTNLVSLVVRGLTAEIRCYATRILKEFAAAGSNFCLLKPDRN